MKTIAITVDEETLERIDRLHTATGEFRSRSAVIRAAIDDFLEQMNRRLEEERESKVLQRNKGQLDKELKELVKEQAT